MCVVAENGVVGWVAAATVTDIGESWDGVEKEGEEKEGGNGRAAGSSTRTSWPTVRLVRDSFRPMPTPFFQNVKGIGGWTSEG